MRSLRVGRVFLSCSANGEVLMIAPLKKKSVFLEQELSFCWQSGATSWQRWCQSIESEGNSQQISLETDFAKTSAGSFCVSWKRWCSHSVWWHSLWCPWQLVWRCVLERHCSLVAPLGAFFSCFEVPFHFPFWVYLIICFSPKMELLFSSQQQ